MISEAASPYSKALFQTASAQNKLDSWQTALQDIADLFNRSPPIFRFFLSPQIAVEQKLKIAKKLLLDPQLFTFFSLLMKQGRIKELPAIAHAFNELVFQERNISEARLILAMPLEKEEKEQLKQELEKTYQKRLEIKEEIDPKLIGGGILLIGGKMVDFSLKGKLERLYHHLVKISHFD